MALPPLSGDAFELTTEQHWRLNEKKRHLAALGDPQELRDAAFSAMCEAESLRSFNRFLIRRLSQG
jgi:hypothetical protein